MKKWRELTQEEKIERLRRSLIIDEILFLILIGLIVFALFQRGLL